MDKKEQTLKEKYWKDGYIFQMSRQGKFRMVWGNKLIDAHGYIPSSAMDDNLINTSTTDNNRVIAIYPPRKDAGWFDQLIEPQKDDNPLWTIARNIMTFDEVKQKLGLSEVEDLYIIKL